MEEKNRNAADVLISMEEKINEISAFIKSFDLNMKILSNKLNNLSDQISKIEISLQQETPKFSVEAVHASNIKSKIPPKELELMDNNLNLNIDNNPIGLRRNSRPETYQGHVKPNNNLQPTNLPSSNEQLSEIKFPLQTLVPLKNDSGKRVELPMISDKFSSKENNIEMNNVSDQEKSFPVMQRVVNSGGKSIFMAEVDISSLDTGKIEKLRTGPTGKWSAALKQGKYEVVIKKYEPASKNKLEVKQVIDINGKQDKFDLQTVILK